MRRRQGERHSAGGRTTNDFSGGKLEPISKWPGRASIARESGGGIANFFLSNEFGLIVGICIFIAIFSWVDANFWSPFNLFVISRSAGVYALIGLSMMAVIATGGLSLAIGAIGVCAAMAFGWAIESAGLHLSASLAVALAVALALGYVNGWLVVRTGIHSFVITLATMSVFFGGMLFLSQGQSFRALPAEITEFGRLKVFSISALFLTAVAVALLLAAFYRFAALGREMLAAGACPEAAELSGVHSGRMFILCHVLSAGLAGIAALLVTARFGAAIPSMAGQLGQDWLMPGFLAPVLGGTLLSGGRVSVPGTVLGAILVTILANGLLRMSIGEFWVQAILGCLLLAAVLGDVMRKRYLAASGRA